MMKHLILFISTILVILQSCNPAINDVTPDETAKKIFTRAELEGIGQMIHFVDGIVSAKTGHTGINESYRAYLDKLSTDVFSGGNFTPLLNDTLKFQFLGTIDDEAFSAIWREDTAYLVWKSQGIKYIDLNFAGKYMKYLQEIGESDERYAKIYEGASKSGDFSPVIVVWFLKNHHELDFTVYKHRLWATIFLLRIAEPIEIPDNFKENLKREERARVKLDTVFFNNKSLD